MKSNKFKRTNGGPIARSNRFFIKLAEYGHLDEKGKVLMGIGLKGRSAAEPDRPLSTLVWGLLALISESADYSSQEAAKEDLRILQERVADLEVYVPPPVRTLKKPSHPTHPNDT